MTASQRFNVGFMFLYGTLWEPADRKEHERFRDSDARVPAFKTGITDWHARCISLPTIAKQTEVWSGNIQTTQVDFELADTDGGASATLYASSTSPLGKPVAIYMKMSENPTYWSAIFTGNIVKSARRKGLITLTLEDSARNLLNSQFVTDYQCLATSIDGILYGTIKDIIGTNVYLDDKYDQTYITVSHGQDSDWVTSILALGLPTVIGVAGGPGGMAAGLLSGILGLFGQSSVNKWDEKYIKIKDYNVIPEGIIAGGQNFKFMRGSVSGLSNGTAGPLYYEPAFKSKGGRFEQGVFGTLELDDILHNAKKGDYIYVEQPLMYWGSPDDIIVNMLTGSNVSMRYTYPDDFSDDWISQTSPLKHIECYANVDNFEVGGISQAIGQMAEEFGFSFYIGEDNKFAVRAVRDVNYLASSVVGTLDESYNVINDGISSVEDLQDNYTDLEFKYKDSFYGKVYEQSLIATLGGATYYGGMKRVKTIQSDWIHDSITGQFIAKRMARRYATNTLRVECEVSLYSGPFKLGEVLRANGWAIGTNKMCEIISYTKDLNRSICGLVAEDAESIYSGRSYFYLQDGAGAITATSRAGFGTVLATLESSMEQCGWTKFPVGWTENEMMVRIANINAGLIPDGFVGHYFKSVPTTGGGVEEVYKCTGITDVGPATSGDYTDFVFKFDRGVSDTMVGSIPVLANLYRTTPFATCFNIGTIYGNSFRWF